MGFFAWQTQILIVGGLGILGLIAFIKKWPPFNKGGILDKGENLFSPDDMATDEMKDQQIQQAFGNANPNFGPGPTPQGTSAPRFDLGSGFSMPIPPGGTTSGPGFPPKQPINGPPNPFTSTVINDPTPTDYGIYTQYLNGLRNEYTALDEQRRIAAQQNIGIGGDITTLPQPPMVGAVPYGYGGPVTPNMVPNVPPMLGPPGYGGPPGIGYRPVYYPTNYGPAIHYGNGSNIDLKQPIPPGSTFGDGNNITSIFPIPPGVIFGKGNNITAPGPLSPGVIIGAGSTYNSRAVPASLTSGYPFPTTGFDDNPFINSTPIVIPQTNFPGNFFPTSGFNFSNTNTSVNGIPDGNALAEQIKEQVRQRLAAQGITASFRGNARQATFVEYDEAPVPSDINGIHPTLFNMVSRNQPAGLMSNKIGNIR